MNYIILIIVGIIGIWLAKTIFYGKIVRSDILSFIKCFRGAYFARHRKSGLIKEQGKRKKENKEKVLEFFRENEKVVNDDIEKLIGVSDATTERYLDELEKEGKIQQHGKTGQSVFYSLIRKD